MSAWNDSGWDGSAWTGASGMQIGFAGDYPLNQDSRGFVADKIHGTDSNPNGPNFAAQEGPDLSAPVILADTQETTQLAGADGWILDNLNYPDYDAIPGGAGHYADMGPATQYGIDPDHDTDVFQISPPLGHGRNFYGPRLYHDDLKSWNSPSTPAPQEHAYPADAREITTGWPEPFVAATVARMPPVMVPDERIDMRWMTEDDRPTYRMLAVPARNIGVSGSVFTPSVPSNTELYNVNVIPEMPRAPDDPWASQEIGSAVAESYDEVDVFNGMGF